MNRKLMLSAAFVATGAGLAVLAIPAWAQSSTPDQRFEAAQRRFDGELAMFKAEVERYERARLAAPVVAPAPAPLPQPSPAVARAEEPRALSDDAVRKLDEPAAAEPAQPQ